MRQKRKSERNSGGSIYIGEHSGGERLRQLCTTCANSLGGGEKSSWAGELIQRLELPRVGSG